VRWWRDAGVFTNKQQVNKGPRRSLAASHQRLAVQQTSTQCQLLCTRCFAPCPFSSASLLPWWSGLDSLGRLAAPCMLSTRTTPIVLGASVHNTEKDTSERRAAHSPINNRPIAVSARRVSSSLRSDLARTTTSSHPAAAPRLPRRERACRVGVLCLHPATRIPASTTRLRTHRRIAPGHAITSTSSPPSCRISRPCMERPRISSAAAC
jgi:hypothetical protein